MLHGIGRQDWPLRRANGGRPARLNQGCGDASEEVGSIRDDRSTGPASILPKRWETLGDVFVGRGRVHQFGSRWRSVVGDGVDFNQTLVDSRAPLPDMWLTSQLCLPSPLTDGCAGV
jgi:hypothetical protein